MVWTQAGNIRGPQGAQGIQGPAGVGGIMDLPAYAPASPAHAWDPHRSAYNRRGAVMHKRRSKHNAAAANAAAFHWGWLGDSTLAAYDGTTFNEAKGLAWRATRAMARLIGHPYPTHGWHLANNANGNVGDRWTTTGTVTATNCLVWSTAGTATHNTPDQCTRIDIAYSNLSPAFTYKVDGEATARTVTPTGANSVGILTITTMQSGAALTNGFHTVVLTVSTNMVIVGQRCSIPSVNQIHCHNLSLGGSRANSGAANINWSSQQSTAPEGLGFVVASLISAAGLAVDDLTVICGNNDIFQGTDETTTIAGIHTMGTTFFPAGTPWSMVHAPMVHGDTHGATFDLLGGKFFTQADADDVPFLDWNNFVNTEASYTADGQAGADGIHPTFPHQLMIGNWIADCLIGHHYYASDMWPGVYGLGGGRFKVVESGGVYAPRPNVPAGAVDFTGPDQPVDILDGDTWDDTP
jgi:hypothetical protein